MYCRKKNMILNKFPKTQPELPQAYQDIYVDH